MKYFLVKALPGVSDIKPLESDFFKEKYVMKIQQNLDGDDASKGVFNQRIIVGLRGLDRPTVIVTEGYFAHYALYPSYKEELCQLFDANVVVCEYRYFAESVPEIVALAGALADAGEHGVAAVLVGDVADELHDEHRLADARAARLRPAPGALPVRCPPSPRAPGEPRPHARFQESLWDLAPAAR